MGTEYEAWQQAAPYGGAVNPDWRPQRLDPIDPCSFHGRDVPERKWLVDGWIPLRTVTMFGGDGGTGKSLCAMQLCAAARGGTWLGLPVAPMKALYVSCEDEQDELHRRQEAINQALGIDFADLDGLEWVDRVGQENLLFAPVLDDKGYRGPPDVTDFYRSVMRHALDNGQGLIVFDSSHDVYGGSENALGRALMPRPGRPKGTPNANGKVPGSGRKAGTPNKASTVGRDYIAKKSSALPFLCDVSSGRKVRVADPDGPEKRIEVYPSFADRIQAVKVLAPMLVPQLKSTEFEMKAADGAELNFQVNFVKPTQRSDDV